MVIEAMRGVVVLLATGCLYGDPHVNNGYRSDIGVDGDPRIAAHSGVDFDADDGDAVLAVAPGTVVSSVSDADGAGLCVLLEHTCMGCEPAFFYTAYCHLQRSLVSAGRPVKRGEQIGEAGHSGVLSGGIAHMHLAMCTFECTFAVRDGELAGTLDPMDFDVGCFDADRKYVPADKPILTHPIACLGR
jgi:murein DD-endopeptidase MepM/ murein hydrolase activator NlpD